MDQAPRQGAKVKVWEGLAVAAALLATVGFAYWMGPNLCEADPTICDDYQESSERQINTLVPVVGLVLGVVVVLGVVKVIVLAQQKAREPKP